MFSLRHKIDSAFKTHARFSLGVALLVFAATSNSIAQTEGPLGDYGDAPEDIEARYQSIDSDLFGQFPSTFESQDDSSFIVHLFPTQGPLLGLDVTNEENALILTGDEDDAWNPFSYLTCEVVTLMIDVSMPTSSVGTDAYLNVLMDLDHDGHWRDASVCSGTSDGREGPLEVEEWAVRNLPLHDEPYNLEPGFTGTIEIPDVMVGPQSGEMWVRFSITSQPVNELVFVPVSQGGEGWNGEGLFLNGETEDYLSCLFGAEREFTPNCPPLGGGGDLQLEITAPDVAVAGEPFELNVQATNNGPGTATNVNLDLPLMEGLELVDARLSIGACDESVSCSLGDILAGESVGGTITLLPNALFAGDEIALDGSLLSDSFDPNFDDNTVMFSIPVARESGLSVSVMPDDEVAIPGEEVGLGITVTNSGPSAAENITVSLPLVDGFDLLSAIPSVGSCDTSVVCEIDVMLPGETANIDVTGLLDQLYSGDVLSLTVSVSSDSIDPDSDDNTFQISLPVALDAQDGDGGANLILDIPDALSVEPGGVLDYAINILNDGPGIAPNVVLTDILPTGLNLVEVIPSQGECNASIICMLGDIGPGETVTVEVNSQVDPEASGILINTLSVLANALDPDTSDNLASIEIEVQAQPSLPDIATDLILEKSADTDLAVPGNEITWTLTVENDGFEIAEDVIVTDILPAGVTLVDVVTTHGSCDFSIRCEIDVLEAGEIATIDISGIIELGFVGSLLTNSASVDSDAIVDVDINNNNDLVDIEISLNPEIDLTLDKQVNQTSLLPGDSVSYTLTVENDNLVTVDDVVVTDILPVGLTLTNVTSSQGECDFTVRCELGAIASGENATIEIEAVLDLGFVGSVLANTADVATESDFLIDIDLDNNSATATVTIGDLVDAEFDLALDKSATQSSLLPGDNVQWVIEVENLGVNLADDVIVTDVLPTGVTLVNVASTQGNCDFTIRCDLGALASGESAKITIDGTLDLGFLGSLLSNSANVTSSSGIDIDLNNNNDLISIDVQLPEITLNPDLSLTKDANLSAVLAGQQVTWTLDVMNNGEGDALNVQLSDILPSGVSLIDVNSSQGSCTQAVICNLGTITAGGGITVGITALVDPGFVGSSLVNNADVSTSGSLDVNLGNNSASVSLPVNLSADLSLDLIGPANIIGGETGTWTLNILNNGPSDALNVSLTDNLPSGLTLIDVSPSQGSCTSLVSCNLGTIEAGGGATVGITALVDPGFVGANLTNSASVSSSGTSDPNNSNNADSFISGVNLEVDLDVTNSTSLGSVIAGEPITFSLVVTNNGPSNANGVTLSDVLPVGLDVIDVDTDTGSCTTSVTCTLGTLEPGEAAVITISANVDSGYLGSALSTTASVSTNSTETNTANNSDSLNVTVNQLADLSVDHDLSLDYNLPLDITATFTVTVTNDGPSDASGVSLTDILPAGVTAMNVHTTQGSCNQTVSCSIGILEPGESAIITITADVGLGLVGSALNITASVSSGTTDPDTTNNSDLISVII